MLPSLMTVPVLDVVTILSLRNGNVIVANYEREKSE